MLNERLVKKYRIMKVGIVIVFNSFEDSTLKEDLIDSINNLNDVSICLVNNKSNEKTDNYLNEISDKCENTSVVNIKKSKSTNSAIRAGARFMFNRHNLKHLGYINDLTSNQLIEIIEIFKINIDEVLDQVVSEQSEKAVKQTLFQKLFSITDTLTALKIKSISYSVA